MGEIYNAANKKPVLNMKRILVLLAFFPLLINAQDGDNPCAQVDKLYEQRTEENIALKAQIKNFKKDSSVQQTCIARLQQDTILYRKQLNEVGKKLSQTEKSLKTVQQQLSKCRKDSATIQKQLDDRKSMTLQQYKDSVDKLNANTAVLVDSIGKLHTSVAILSKDIQKQKNELKQLNAIVDLLSKRYEKASLDELFSLYDKGELTLYKDLCPLVGKKVSTNVEQTLICYKAQEQLKLKYDKYQVEQLQRQLPQNSKIGKKLFQSLQHYASVNAEADALWKQIRTDVCSKPIDDDNFLQIQAKRQIWQRAQKFLNKYPALSPDYPYIHDQIQAMLREIWINVNNFNKINNPFE